MCKYCDVDMLGDCADEPVINETVTDIKGRSLYLAVARIGTRSTGEGQLCLDVYDSGSDPLMVACVDIKFCPFCGREFKKEN